MRMIFSTEIIDNHTDDESLWHGISSSHDTIQDMLSELVDDSVSSIVSNDCQEPTVILTISENVPNEWNSPYYISVEDNGAGIKNLGACLAFANMEAGESPLNRYGVGLKKVLATFDPSNAFWSIQTRNESDCEEDSFKLIKAPYRLGSMKMYRIKGEAWKGQLRGSGTIVEFPCSDALLASAAKDYPTQTTSFNGYIKDIEEELAINYMPHIRDGLQIITKAVYKDGTSCSTVLPYCTPLWNENKTKIEIETEVDFGSGLCKVKAIFGYIENHPSTQRHFQKTLDNSGVYFYENGRLIEGCELLNIWKKHSHPTYNDFIGIVEINPIDDASALPSPTPTKNAFFYGDPKVHKLYEWVRSVCPNPKKLESGKSQQKKTKKERKQEEHHRREKLVKRLKEIHGESAIIDIEKPFFYNVDANLPRVDIYMFADNEVSLIECKAFESSALDVSQLRMYHDGALHDGIEPKVLWLVAESHPKTVQEYVRYLNSGESVSWRYELKTWQDFGIA